MALPLAEKVTTRVEPARRLAREAVEAAAPHFRAAARSWAAWARNPRGRGEEPLARYQDELREAAAGRDRRRETVRLANLASAYRRRGDLPNAQICATRALDVARETKDERLLGLALNGLGLVQAHHPVPAPAVATFQEARGVFTRLGDHQLEGQILANLGNVHARLGERQSARAVWAEALGLLAPDSSAHQELSAWLAAHPEADPAEDETAESQSSAVAV